MSVPRTTRRTVALAAASGVVATALFTLGAPAAADPPAVDFDVCDNTLQRAGVWPGELGDGSRPFSDGFDSYLSRQPACAGTAPVEPDSCYYMTGYGLQRYPC